MIWLILILGCVAYFAYNMNQSYQRRIAVEEAERIKVEAKNQQNLKFNKVVTCPKCNGSKECLIYREIKHYTDEPKHTALSYVAYADNKNKDGTEGTRQDGFIEWSYEKYLCPFCMGSGKIYAYFENNRCHIRAKQDLEKMRAYLEGGYRSSLSNEFQYEFDVPETTALKESATERNYNE